MPSITFEPTSPSAHLSFPLDGDPPKNLSVPTRRGVSWSVRVAHRPPMRQQVRISTGGKLNDLPGRVGIFVGVATPNGKAQYKAGDKWGILSYHEGREEFPENYAISLYVSATLLDQLVRLAELGRPPTLNVDLGDDLMLDDKKSANEKFIKYGWEPDGSGLEWDNKSARVLEIMWCGFSSELGTPDTRLDEDEDIDSNLLLPPTRADVTAINATVGKISTDLSQLTRTVQWIGLLILIAFVVSRWIH
jgi:hypothetical protein